MSELLVILLIALLVIKPEQLPEVAHSVGKMIRSIRQLLAKVKNEMHDFVDIDKRPADSQPAVSGQHLEKKREQA